MNKVSKKIHLIPRRSIYVIGSSYNFTNQYDIICNYIDCKYVNYEKLLPEEAVPLINSDNISICENCDTYLRKSRKFSE